MRRNDCDRCHALMTGAIVTVVLHGAVVRDLCLGCYKLFVAWCAAGPEAPVSPMPVKVVHTRPRRVTRRKQARR